MNTTHITLPQTGARVTTASSGTIMAVSGTNISTTGTTGTNQLIYSGGNMFAFQPNTTYYTYNDHLRLNKGRDIKRLRIIRNALRRNKPLYKANNIWR